MVFYVTRINFNNGFTLHYLMYLVCHVFLILLARQCLIDIDSWCQMFQESWTVAVCEFSVVLGVGRKGYIWFLRK